MTFSSARFFLDFHVDSLVIAEVAFKYVRYTTGTFPWKYIESQHSGVALLTVWMLRSELIGEFWVCLHSFQGCHYSSVSPLFFELNPFFSRGFAALLICSIVLAAQSSVYDFSCVLNGPQLSRLAHFFAWCLHPSFILGFTVCQSDVFSHDGFAGFEDLITQCGKSSSKLAAASYISRVVWRLLATHPWERCPMGTGLRESSLFLTGPPMVSFLGILPGAFCIQFLRISMHDYTTSTECSFIRTKGYSWWDI